MRLNRLEEAMKIYRMAETGNGGSGSVAKDFDYAQVDTALTSIEANITKISDVLSTKISVTSYQGDAQAEVESAVDSIRTYLQTMKQPLDEIKSKVNEVREAYATSESGIKSSLSGISGSVE